MTSRRLVIAAGGTGGHMFPAQALAEEALRRGWRVALASDARGLRYAGGFPPEVERRETVSATLARGGLAERLRVPLTLARGVLAARRRFAAERPDCVAGFGGYPSLPALAAAWSLRLPRIIHEQNGVLGRVNRAFAGRVDLVACGTWPLTNAPAGARLTHVGNPVRGAALAAAETPYAPPDAEGPLRLLVFGGSQGARILGETAPAAAAALAPGLRTRLRVTHQVRPEGLEAARAAYAAAGVEAEVAPFFDDLPARMARAHLVVSRAGASTLAELTVIGRPAILTPFAAAMDDHQTANARALAEAGAAESVAESALTPAALAGHVARLLGEPARLAAMAAAAKGLGRPTAAADLADLIESLAERRPSRP